ncbi:hypothetical protein M378DRAFT_1068223 [Amanita muscaria Koide BX008]|uniref:Chromatin-remodeling ATPase INO80 n=1 Tax=Amanita muscaria (strain Koide BX008) TaxID=946122 RepID=A0A0C2S953_AMAMK|nr:hypothetical protein M378DRAFT_1068223 [Amanita muscaria Koide BX008]
MTRCALSCLNHKLPVGQRRSAVFSMSKVATHDVGRGVKYQGLRQRDASTWISLLELSIQLLTCTPIQNSMQELWACLHFITPSLFDSHQCRRVQQMVFKRYRERS